MPIGDSGNDLTNLQQTRSNLIQQLQSLSLIAGPDYSLDGQTISKAAYMRNLEEQITVLDRLIQTQFGPLELQTVAVPGFGPWGGGAW